MRESFGDPKRAARFTGENLANPLTVGWRAFVHVDGYVEYLTLHHGNQLRLLHRIALPMKPPQHTFSRPRVIILHEFDIPTDCFVEAVPLPRLKEETPGVLEDIRLDDYHSGQFCWQNPHDYKKLNLSELLPSKHSFVKRLVLICHA